MKFGENLRQMRKRKKFSQEDLAEKVKVSRQSVSKWETGEAYPEMNNILELCKIFHCHIGELVNDQLIDVDALDEEIKKNVVKFKDDQQKNMKILSKTMSMIAKICKILVTISFPAIIVSMLILGVLITKIEYKNGEFRLDGFEEKIVLVEDEDETYVKIGGHEFDDYISVYTISKTFEILEHNSKTMLIFYVEIGFTFLIIYLILIRIILSNLEKLFKNINAGDTPFTLENVKHIKTMAYLLIVATLMPTLIGLLFEWILQTDLDLDFQLFSIIEILFLFSIAYIFQYGYEIQLDSIGKMYGTREE